MATHRRLRTNVKQIAEMLKSLHGSNNNNNRNTNNNMSKHVQFIACLSLILSVCQAMWAAFVTVLWPSIWASSSVQQRPRSQQATLPAFPARSPWWSCSINVRNERIPFKQSNNGPHCSPAHTHTRTHADSGLLSLCANNGKSDSVPQQVSVGSLKIDALYYTEEKGLF